MHRILPSLILIQLIASSAVASFFGIGADLDRQVFFAKAYCLSQKLETHPQVLENKKIFDRIQNALDTSTFNESLEKEIALKKCKKIEDTLYSSQQVDKENICRSDKSTIEDDIKYETYVAYYEALEKLKSSGIEITFPLPKAYIKPKNSLAGTLLGIKQKEASDFKRADLYAAYQFARIEFIYQGKKYSLSPGLDSTRLSLIGSPQQEKDFDELFKKPNKGSSKDRAAALSKTKSSPTLSLGETYDIENQDLEITWVYDTVSEKYRYNDSHFGDAMSYFDRDEIPYDAINEPGKTWGSCFAKNPRSIQEERQMTAALLQTMDKDSSFCNAKNASELRRQFRKKVPDLVRCQDQGLQYLLRDRGEQAPSASPIRKSGTGSGSR